MPGEVHPEAGPVVDTKFKNAVSYRFAVSKITGLNTADTGIYYSLCYIIFDTSHPVFESLCFPYHYHKLIVSYRIRKIKRIGERFPANAMPYTATL
jgi:hypothetical protein